MTSHPSLDGKGPAAHANAAIQTYFGGDTALFAACRAASMAQLPEDLRAGHQAAGAQDLPALCRTTHTLKSVMLLVGFPDVSEMAAVCEDACSSGMTVQAQESWALLASRLDTLITTEIQ